MNFDKSTSIFHKAQEVLPGGVNSPVRAFSAVGGKPVLIKKAKGSKLFDVDGNQYVDFMGSWGTALLGHSHEEVVEFIKETLDSGLSFGATHENELILAERVLEAFDRPQKIRFVNSGTEACMTAVRLARGYTKRDLIIKFDGHYHGHSDCLLTKAGSGVATLGIPASPGIPDAVTASTLSIPFNNIEALEEVFQKYSSSIAAIILEPIAGNCGFIRPEKGFLQSLSAICQKNGSLLIFDEVMTGFRVARGGAQNLFQIKPDLSTFGKVIGGGLPLAALAGRPEVMDHLAPNGQVYQAGTLSGNPVAVAAGLKTMEILKSKTNIYEDLSKKCDGLLSHFKKIASDYGIPLQTDFEGGLFGFSFSESKVSNFAETKKINFDRFASFFRNSLELGCYFPPSAYEACFMSDAHTEEDLVITSEVFKKFCQNESLS